jgi:hypothetical protein
LGHTSGKPLPTCNDLFSFLCSCINCWSPWRHLGHSLRCLSKSGCDFPSRSATKYSSSLSHMRILKRIRVNAKNKREQRNLHVESRNLMREPLYIKWGGSHKLPTTAWQAALPTLPILARHVPLPLQCIPSCNGLQSRACDDLPAQFTPQSIPHCREPESRLIWMNYISLLGLENGKAVSPQVNCQTFHMYPASPLMPGLGAGPPVVFSSAQGCPLGIDTRGSSCIIGDVNVCKDVESSDAEADYVG